MELENINPLVLAFIGDSVHTQFVRQFFSLQENVKMSTLHKKCSEFCNAKTQAKVLDAIMPYLSIKEQNIARKARNCKTNNVPNCATIEEYKKATSFEAIVGYLHLTKQFDNLEKILNQSINMFLK